MSSADLTKREFTLQSRPMTEGRTFNADEAVEPFVRLLGTPLPEPVLDLACGPGIVTAAVARTGTRVVALDLTDEMLAAARRRCEAAALANVEFRAGHAEKLPFEPGSFDGAVTRLSIHHFEHPDEALSELHRVLSPEGVLVIGDIVASADAPAARLHNSLEKLRDPSHVRLLDEAELTRAVEHAGFRVDTIEAWENRKTFTEWAAVVSEARSVEPVREVMHALARAGVDAGIELASVGDEVHFTHPWRFVRAVAV
ncbi:MAG: class I SAM-dependent methyltransferase [Myxococcota bacterium]